DAELDPLRPAAGPRPPLPRHAGRHADHLAVRELRPGAPARLLVPAHARSARARARVLQRSAEALPARRLPALLPRGRLPAALRNLDAARGGAVLSGRAR